MGSKLEVPQDLIGSSGIYNVPDPLLRRLRLEDSVGAPILDLDRYFKQKEVLVLYAGSEQGSNNLTEFHRNLTAFAIGQLQTCSVIYISSDTNPLAPRRVLAQKPWLRMTFNDNSDFAPMVTAAGEKGRGAEMEEVSRGEEFIQAGEIESGQEIVRFGEEEYQHDYVRPLSRAAMTSIMDAFATPSISIYHIPSHVFIARNVKISAFAPLKVDKNYHTWRNGGKPSLRVVDVLQAMKWPILLIIIGILTHVTILEYGPQYNFLPKIMDWLSYRAHQAGQVRGPSFLEPEL